MSGFGTEKDQDRRRKRLKTLLQQQGNRTCCDCNQRQPQWASVNLGLFFCIRCSGIHRNLGVHISVVRSITLDSWKESWVNMLSQVGNERGNAFWEAKPPGPRKPDERASDHQLEQFIRDKYVRGLWRGPETEAPHSDSSTVPVSATNLQPQALSSPAPSNSSTQSFQRPLQPQIVTPQSSAQQQPVQFQRTATDQQHQQHQQPRRGQSGQTTLSQNNSAIRQPSQQAQQAHLQQTNPTNPFGRLDSNSNKTITQPPPQQQQRVITSTAASNSAPSMDIDFESFFQDDQPTRNNNNNTSNISQQSQLGSPLADLFAPSTTANTANSSQHSTPQSAPPPHTTSNDPFAMLSQPNVVDAQNNKTTDSILSLYNSPTPQQHQQHQQQQMQSPYAQMQPSYGYPQQHMYVQPMPMGAPMNANPYEQPQMQHPNAHAAFGTYSYAAPTQSGLPKQANQSNSQNFDVFAGFM